MTVSFALLADRLQRSQTPEETRDLLLQIGFSGLVFQRWHADHIENWEGKIAPGFLEHYYGAELDEHCAIARAIHSWSRSYTFSEARRELARAIDPVLADRVKRLFDSFGMVDGVVILTGTQTVRSSVILTCGTSCQSLYEQQGGLLHLAAYRLTQQLHPGHTLLSAVPRKHPILSDMQQRILQMQIDHPEMSSADMAQALGMSPKTLHAHHKKIARKTGVTTFAGAVLRHLHQQR